MNWGGKAWKPKCFARSAAAIARRLKVPLSHVRGRLKPRKRLPPIQ